MLKKRAVQTTDARALFHIRHCSQRSVFIPARSQ